MTGATSSVSDATRLGWGRDHVLLTWPPQMWALLVRGPHPENTGHTARPNTAAPPGVPPHALGPTVGPPATRARCLLRRLLSSLRHVCLFFLVGARPGRRVPPPHSRGTELLCGSALGDGGSSSPDTQGEAAQRRGPPPRPAGASPAPQECALSSPCVRHGAVFPSPLSCPLSPLRQPAYPKTVLFQTALPG